jgi:hypothetical protein
MNTAEIVNAGKIWSGEHLSCVVTWHDTDENAEIPAGVVYQVFDATNNAVLTPVRTVSSPAATMSFPIPAADLPIGNSASSRRLFIEITATFADGTILPVVGLVTVARTPSAE